LNGELKPEGAAMLTTLATRCPKVALVPLIESGAGLDATDDIARACKGI
jgi:hypothetical protein